MYLGELQIYKATQHDSKPTEALAQELCWSWSQHMFDIFLLRIPPLCVCLSYHIWSAAQDCRTRAVLWLAVMIMRFLPVTVHSKKPDPHNLGANEAHGNSGGP